jgi:hypothetical protein
MLIKKIIPGFYNGVSQQPAALRLDTQCELAENMYGTLIDGLIRRPNTDFITTLESNVASNAYVHTINRDKAEKYIMAITNDTNNPIEIFKLDGAKCTVNYADTASKTYCTATDPKNSFKAVTIADYTILANTTTKCLKNTSWVAPNDNSAEYFIYVKRGIIKTNYQIVYTEPTSERTILSSYTTDETTTNTETIATNILNALTTTTSTYTDMNGTVITTTTTNPTYTALVNAGWVLTRIGSTIRAYNPNTSGVALGTFSVTDGYGDLALVCTKKIMSSFSDLWKLPWKDKLFTIVGDANNSFTRYYVKTENANGTWVETVLDTINNSFEASTLPHQIVRTAENTFTVSTINWGDRIIGDEVSAPDPSFVNNYIKGVFFFQNRLGFLAGENVILSRASDYFNFFPTTALEVLDDDPIDVAASTTQVNILQSALPFNSNLLLDSNQQQFILTAGDSILTPKTVQIKPITKYNTSPTCMPTSAGTNLYYAVPLGKYSGIKEYFVQPDTFVTDAADITSHVDRYIPSDITTLLSCVPVNMIFAFGESNPNTLYQYSYLWQGNDKVQSAWTKWTLDDAILGLTTIDYYLYLLVKKANTNQVCMLKMDLTHVNTGELSFRVYLDKQVSLTGSYDSTTNQTTWTLPYTDASTAFKVINSVTGLELAIKTKVSDTTITAIGNYSTVPYYIGKTYTSTYRFSEWYNKQNENKVGDLEGKLQLKKLLLHFEESGPFRIVVTPYRREAIVHDYSGIILGLTYLDTPILVSKIASFLLMCNSKSTTIDLICDSYLPVRFILAELIGNFVSSARLV